MNPILPIGILALQGDFAEHAAILRCLDHVPCEVRTVDDLSQVGSLILPGGESTVLSMFLRDTGLDAAIKERNRAGTLPLMGTCAGAILLAKEIEGDDRVTPLGLIDMTIERNAYGRQIDSFRTTVLVDGFADPLTVAFIRAPQITRTGPTVEILARHNDQPVLVRQGDCIAATFHPEVAGETALHAWFLSSMSA